MKPGFHLLPLWHGDTPPGSAALAGALADLRRVTSAGLARLGLDPA